MAQVEKQKIRKVITSTMIGNGLEWYDYALYGTFTALISKHFFPAGNEAAALIATFGIFAVGFFMRPLGAMFFGYIGDKYGRKNALALSILMMSIPTACIGLLPTYQSIGILAPILLTIIRLVQGVAVGGEFGGSIVYMVEHSTEKNKNLLGSTTILSMLVGLLFGALISTFLAQALSAEDFESWGWRIPFILGFFIGVVGLYIRNKLDESPAFMDAKETGHISDKPVKEALRYNYKEILFGIGIYLSVTIPFYIQTVFMNSFMVKFLKFDTSQALTIYTIILLVMMVITPISARLCDKYDREKLLKFTLAAYILYSFPYIYFLQSGMFIPALISQVIFAGILAFYLAPIPALLVDIFPTKTRYTGMSLACNLAAAIFGGTAPILITKMIGHYGSNYFISYYVIFAAVISFICITHIKTRFHYNI
jgi:MHS family proline/betaine transporter-like MFS transporter